jgi:hypothetical protein
MMRAHQPGSQPIDIPETIPNPAVPQPVRVPGPPPKQPVKVPTPSHDAGTSRQELPHRCSGESAWATSWHGDIRLPGLRKPPSLSPPHHAQARGRGCGLK